MPRENLRSRDDLLRDNRGKLGRLIVKKLRESIEVGEGVIVDHLSERGVISAALLYESPFTDVTPKGPDDIFTPSQFDELLAVIENVRATAVAA